MDAETLPVRYRSARFGADSSDPAAMREIARAVFVGYDKMLVFSRRQSPRGGAAVAVVEKRIVGFSLWNRIDDNLCFQLAVLPGFRRQGVGTQLLRQTLQSEAAHAAANLWTTCPPIPFASVVVPDEDAAANAFLQRHLFRRRGDAGTLAPDADSGVAPFRICEYRVPLLHLRRPYTPADRVRVAAVGVEVDGGGPA